LSYMSSFLSVINIKKPFVVIRTKGFEFVIPPITYILTYALPLTQEIRQSLLDMPQMPHRLSPL